MNPGAETALFRQSCRFDLKGLKFFSQIVCSHVVYQKNRLLRRFQKCEFTSVKNVPKCFLIKTKIVRDFAISSGQKL
jgi:hypothetical protein